MVGPVLPLPVGFYLGFLGHRLPTADIRSYLTVAGKPWEWDFLTFGQEFVMQVDFSVPN